MPSVGDDLNFRAFGFGYNIATHHGIKNIVVFYYRAKSLHRKPLIAFTFSRGIARI